MGIYNEIRSFHFLVIGAKYLFFGQTKNVHNVSQCLLLSLQFIKKRNIPRSLPPPYPQDLPPGIWFFSLRSESRMALKSIYWLSLTEHKAQRVFRLKQKP